MSSSKALELINRAKSSNPTYLEIGRCGISKLPDALFDKLPDLETLIVSDRWQELKGSQWNEQRSRNYSGYNKLTAINPRISELKNLKRFVCSTTNNDFSVADLTPLQGLTNLETLDLRGNKIFNLAPLEKLTNLKTLILRENKIIKIDSLAKLTMLETLSLSNNKLGSLPDLSALRFLKYLALNANQLTKIDGLDSLTALQYLHLDNNKITSIENLEKLTLLTALSLNNNQISTIENLEHLTDLKELFLNKNKIKKFDNLQRLHRLKKLFLKDNKISSVDNMVLPPTLKALDLSNNKIKDITPLRSAIEDKKLTLVSRYYMSDNNNKLEINLYDNPLVTPPDNYINQGNEKIAWWFTIKDKERLYEPIKELLVADKIPECLAFLKENFPKENWTKWETKYQKNEARKVKNKTYYEVHDEMVFGLFDFVGE